MPGPREEFTGTERFAVERLLGRGAFGVVYQVYDRERRARVALKRLVRFSPEALYRFKQEFRSLADVSHPNLAALYELLSDGERWFITMELVSGSNFLEYVRPAGSTPVGPTAFAAPPPPTRAPALRETAPRPLGDRETADLTRRAIAAGMAAPATDLATLPHAAAAAPLFLTDRLREALRQIATGLDALHGAGKLHRDLKPSNVLVNHEGRVVILDFGLVAEVEPSPVDESRAIVGTPVYMSPEQALGAKGSPPSDWYAVGVMLYESLTGHLPFWGRVDEVLDRKVRHDPVPAERLAAGIPEDSRLLCQGLLERDPKNRPTGPEVLERLGRATGERDSSGPSSPLPPPSLRSAAFVGRQAHLLALDQAFRSVAITGAVAVRIHGQSGMGKSALLSRFLDQLQQGEPRAVVLAGRCYEREAVPYKAFDSVIDALTRYLRRLSSHEQEVILPRDAASLARLFPVLLEIAAVRTARRQVQDAAEDLEVRRRAFGALRELLQRLADRRPLVVAIDDLQWGDLDSAALLEEVLRPPDPPALLLLLSYRGEDAAASPFLRLLLTQLERATTVSVRDLAVEGLSPAETEQLVLALTGAEVRLSAEGTEAIARESGGHPFLATELVAYRQLSMTDDTAFGQGSALDSGLRRASLDHAIRARVMRLPEGAQRLLESLAVAGGPIEAGVAGRAADLQQHGPAVFAALRSARLVRSRGGGATDTIETYHDRIREAVLSVLPEAALRDRHLRLAVALEETGRADPEELALHFASGGEGRRAAAFAAVAAARAAEALAFDRAARLYRLALAGGRFDAERVRALQVGLGDALVNAARGVDAAPAYLAAAEGADPAFALELRRRAAEGLLRNERFDQGLAILRAVLESVGIALPATPRRALPSVILRRLWLRLRGHGFRERDAASVPVEDSVRIDACWTVATALGNPDPIRSMDIQTRGLLLALAAGEPYRVARALAVDGAYESIGGGPNHARTERILALTTALAERIDHPHARAMASWAASIAAYDEGRWREAIRHSEQAEGILRQSCRGVSWEIANTRLYALSSLLYLGEIQEIHRRFPSLTQPVDQRGDLQLPAYVQDLPVCILHLAAGDPERAEREVAEAVARWGGLPFVGFIHLALMSSEVCVAIYRGDGAVAQERLERRWPSIASSLVFQSQFARAEAYRHRAYASLAAAAAAMTDDGGPPSRDFLKGVERDARRLERERMPWLAGFAPIIRAAASAMAGERARVAAFAATAAHAFGAAEMAGFAAAARRRHGQLVGGERGQELVAEADASMRQKGIQDPARMSDMLAPGFWVVGGQA